MKLLETKLPKKLPEKLLSTMLSARKRGKASHA